MIGSVIYGLKWAVTHPLHSLALLAPFAATPLGQKLGFAFARTAVFQLGRMLLDSGEIGKIFFEELKRPAGSPKPPLYRGTELQKAVQLGRGAVTRGAISRVAPIGRFLLLTPFRAYLTAATITTGAGYAVGRTHGVRTAPALQTRYVMGAPM